MLAKELQNSLVTPLILSLDAIIAEIGAGGHPAVDLVTEDLDVLGDGQSVLELLDIRGGLILGGQHGERDSKALGIGGIDHGGMGGGSDAEGVGRGLGGQGDDLASPAELRCEKERK